MRFFKVVVLSEEGHYWIEALSQLSKKTGLRISSTVIVNQASVPSLIDSGVLPQTLFTTGIFSISSTSFFVVAVDKFCYFVLIR